MKKSLRFIALALVGLHYLPLAVAQVPGIITYHGVIQANGNKYKGTGQFKFALLNGLNGESLWSNDDSSFDGSEPTAPVAVEVNDGLFTVLLGDTSLQNMTAIPIEVFANSDVRLRVWFSDNNNNGFEQLSSDQRVTSVGYAMRSASVSDGAITSDALADGAVTGDKLADAAVTSMKLSPLLDLGDATTLGRLRVFHTSSGAPGIVLDGASSSVTVNGGDGVASIELLQGFFGGEVSLNDALGHETTAVLRAGLNTGGQLFLRDATGQERVLVTGTGDKPGGEIELRSDSGQRRAELFGNAPDLADLLQATGGGGLDLRAADGGRTIAMRGQGSAFKLFSAVTGNQGVDLSGESGQVRAVGSIDLVAGFPGVIWASLFRDIATGGQLRLRDENGTETALLGSQTIGGYLRLNQLNGVVGVQLNGYGNGDPGGNVVVYRGDATPTVVLDGQNDNGVGQVSVRNAAGRETVALAGGQPSNPGGQLFLISNSGNTNVSINAHSSPTRGARMGLRSINGAFTLLFDGDSGNATGSGEISVRNASGDETVEIVGAETSGTGAQVVLRQANGTNTVVLDAEHGANGGGIIDLSKGDGTVTISLDADENGEGVISTQVLKITGGSDLSEKFDVRAPHEPPQPGMLVCIDPENPGQLAVSMRAYDSAVAGVVSGAGGVKPGMLMGQAGSAADGKHPVALTGRVYCLADASGGAIRPGDLLTTSDTPGHAMKVTDHARAHGAVIGKAMTGLKSGQGLVLVLVSLQ